MSQAAYRIDDRLVDRAAFYAVACDGSAPVWEVDPVGFEPTIFSLQRRRLPARLRARNNAEL